MKVTLKPFEGFQPSVNRNNKSRGITFVDTSGKPIKGDIKRHYTQVYQKQKERFDIKFEAYSLLQQEELKELFLTNPKDKVKGNTDKLAVAQAYYNSVYKAYSELTLEQLTAISNEELDVVAQKALEHNLELKKQEQEQTN